MSDVLNRLLTDETGKELVEGLEKIKNAIVGEKTNPIYGIKRSLNSTSTGWIRTDDAYGLQAQATKDGSEVYNDFNKIYPWSEIITVNYDVENDRVVAEYGDANFAFDGSNGEVMTYIPTHYAKRWTDENNEYRQIARYFFKGSTKVDGFYIGRYTTSDGAHSVSGVLSTVSQNITTFRNQAKAKGNGWGQLDWRYCVLQNLYLVEYANGDSQAMLGNGVSGDSAQHASGECDSLGMNSGCMTNDSKHSVIYRGIENPFGNIWQFVDGINIKDYQAYICYEPSQYVVDKFTEPYQPLGYVNASTNGNPKNLGYDENNQLIGITTEIGTSSYGDYYWQSTGNRIVRVGGSWNYGSNDGFFYWHCHNASGGASAAVGGRLLKTSV